MKGHPKPRLLRKDRVGNTGRASTSRRYRRRLLPPLEELLREGRAA